METKTPLPDPLVMNDGTRVTTPEQWRARRAELLELFSREMYGRMPGRPQQMRFEVFDNDPHALGGRATRRQVAIFFNGDASGPRADLLLYLPNGAPRPVPVILGLNFWGNHAIHTDPEIRLSTSYMESGKSFFIDLSKVENNLPNDASRGVNSWQWPVETILARGYGLATMYREDIASDRPEFAFTTGVHPLFPELQNRHDNFGTIAAWAWSLSRALDYLETDVDVDAKRVAAFGWSRLGKAALWAGANDERFALVISNESGAGGAKLFHRGVGESVRRLNMVFPHWYCGNFRLYIGRDTELPFDQHMMMALIAPRPFYIGSTADDLNADPEGEFAGAQGADSVYRFLGTEGLPANSWPAVDQPVHGRIGYHVRAGRHDVTGYDWAQYLDFADRWLR